MLKKTLFAGALMVVSSSSFAQSNCDSRQLQFNPVSSSKEACSQLGFAGAGEVKSCVEKKAVLTNSRGEVYNMVAGQTEYSSHESYVDSDTQEVIQLSVSVDLINKKYQAHEVLMDSRGHTRSMMNCSGDLSIK